MVGEDIMKSDVSSERRHRISQSAYHLSQPDDLEIRAIQAVISGWQSVR